MANANSDANATDRDQLHLAVRLAGASAGHDPAAWRAATARPERLFTADHLVDLVCTAERGTLDLVLLDDSFVPQPSAAGHPRGRLDALLAAARVAPATRAIGLVPTIDVTHTEPFHVSKNLASLDLVSRGRAGWRVGISTSQAEARLFGRKPAAPHRELLAEAAEVVDVVARLWDSWEDDAVIRDRPTGRYIDRDKVHYVDFTGRFFSVRGPSITPRPPQGQPLVVVDVDSEEAAALAAERADVALIEAGDPDTARSSRRDIRWRARGHGRDPDEVAVLVSVDLDDDVVDAPAELADLLEDWFRAGAGDGFVVRPARLPHGLDLLVDEVVPRLRRRGVFRSAYAGRTLRSHFGLERPPNRYAAAVRGRNGS